MSITFVPRALRDLDAISTHISLHDPQFTKRVLQRLEALMTTVWDIALLGQPTRFPGVQVTAIPQLLYQIYYRRLPSEVRVLRIRQGRCRPLR